MKALIFSDLHLHSWKPEPGEWFSKKLEAQKQALSRMIADIKQNPVDVIVFCGDFYHAHGVAAADVSNVAYDFMKELAALNTETFMLVGNHDRPYRDLPLHGMTWMRDYATVIEPGTVATYTLADGTPLKFLSYSDDPEFIKQALSPEKVTSNEIVFMHQGVTGIPLGSGRVLDESLDASMIAPGIRHVFTGHYHHHVTKGNITVVGAFTQLNWADTKSTCGWLEVDLATLKITQIDSGAPRYVQCFSTEETRRVSKGDHVRILFPQAEEYAKHLKDHGVFVEYLPIEETRTVPMTVGVTSLEAVLKDYEVGLSSRRVEVGRSIRSL